MKILHITPHLGGGVGTVIMGWLDKAGDAHTHMIFSLDAINEKAIRWSSMKGVALYRFPPLSDLSCYLSVIWADIVLVHYWDHPMLADLFSKEIPDCRLVWWCHKNVPYSPAEVEYPDIWIDTSPIQGHGRHIWSTGDISRFLEITPKAHKGFNIGYCGTVDYKKIHPNVLDMCKKIKAAIREAHFAFIGEDKISGLGSGVSVIDPDFSFIGKVDDVAPYLAEMDLFMYPLRPDHYGTCEQALGEAMAAEVVPVVMDNPAEQLIVGSDLRANTEQGYVELVVYLYHHPFMREMQARCVRELAKAQYSIDRMIHQWNEVFEEMMKLPKRGRNPL